jgi:hypothetical protein
MKLSDSERLGHFVPTPFNPGEQRLANPFRLIPPGAAALSLDRIFPHEKELVQFIVPRDEQGKLTQILVGHIQGKAELFLMFQGMGGYSGVKYLPGRTVVDGYEENVDEENQQPHQEKGFMGLREEPVHAYVLSDKTGCCLNLSVGIHN